ncbi:anaerobic glycerol-3-phosphate dehydrogenase subunit A [Halobacteriales archaeon QS_4_69_34]|nr:MAG: anaerobic glycerol-3-phosphate dehydrogenase subunit A [Halobacteriales archaeon QS_4_69_34]
MDAETEVAVVGGGATGTGVVRDLTLRGIDATLIERGSLTSGTTGRMHGLLHSGARYAVSDPASARECSAESRVLREIAGHCIEPVGGLFVELPADSEDYFERKLAGCRDCEIPAAVLSAGEAVREAEPAIARDARRAIQVPDAVIDPFRLCAANAVDAAARGAHVRTHAEVTDVLVEDDRVRGIEVHHGSGSEERRGRDAERIEAEYVVNATGAWAGQFGALAGVEIGMAPSKGAMAVLDGRAVDTVLNRCRPRSAGDIAVPHESTCVLGTTDVPIDDPDVFDKADREIDRLVEELAALVPAFADARVVDAYWGVRPLYEPSPSDGEDSTGRTRDFALLDHEARDGLAGLASIVGGKLTTHRLMAEALVDHVCERLGYATACRTADVALPGGDDPAVLRERMAEFGIDVPVGRNVRRAGGSGR